jgi:hypothetical protein
MVRMLESLHATSVQFHGNIGHFRTLQGLQNHAVEYLSLKLYLTIIIEALLQENFVMLPLRAGKDRSITTFPPTLAGDEEILDLADVGIGNLRA